MGCVNSWRTSAPHLPACMACASGSISSLLRLLQLPLPAPPYLPTRGTWPAFPSITSLPPGSTLLNCCAALRCAVLCLQVLPALQQRVRRALLHAQGRGLLTHAVQGSGVGRLAVSGA